MSMNDDTFQCLCGGVFVFYIIHGIALFCIFSMYTVEQKCTQVMNGLSR